VLDTKSPKYLEMAQGHISLSTRRERRRYTVETPLSILLSMMRVTLVMMMMIYLFSSKALTLNKYRKINELVKTINEKDELLENQEDLLNKENKNFVKLKEALAHETENAKT
jgi:hypothetical protein